MQYNKSNKMSFEQYIVPDNKNDNFHFQDSRNNFDCAICCHYVVLKNIPEASFVKVYFQYCNVYIGIIDKSNNLIFRTFDFSISGGLVNLQTVRSIYYENLSAYILAINMSNSKSLNNVEDINTADAFVIEDTKAYEIPTTIVTEKKYDANFHKIHSSLKNKNNFIEINHVPSFKDNLQALTRLLHIFLRFDRSKKFRRFVNGIRKKNSINLIDYFDPCSHTTLLHSACCYSSLRLIQFIIRLSQNKLQLLTLKNNFDHSAVQCAKSFGRKQIVAYLNNQIDCMIKNNNNP